MSNILQDLIVELRAEAAFNRSFVDGSRDRPVAASPGYDARRTELAEQRDAWADAVEKLLAASPVEQHEAAPAPYDGLTAEFVDEVARLCNDAPGSRNAVYAALRSCNAIIAPAEAQHEAAPADALPIMRKAFRVTEVSGDPDPAKQSFAMRFSFPSIDALHAANDEWNKFIAATQPEPQVADERAAFEEWWKSIAPSNFDYTSALAGYLARASSPNAAGAEGAKLDKPAKVGATRFGVGVKWSTVIGAAQRLYEYDVTPGLEAARIERARSVLEDIQNGKYSAPRTDVAGAMPNPTGDQLRWAVKSVGSFGTNHADAPHEYVLAGWRAAMRAATPSADAAAAPADAQAVEAVATLHDDGHYIWNPKVPKPDGYDRAGWKMPVYAAPPPPAPASAPVGLTEGELAVLEHAACFLEEKHSRAAAEVLRALLSSLGGDRS